MELISGYSRGLRSTACKDIGEKGRGCYPDRCRQRSDRSAASCVPPKPSTRVKSTATEGVATFARDRACVAMIHVAIGPDYDNRGNPCFSPILVLPGQFMQRYFRPELAMVTMNARKTRTHKGGRSVALTIRSLQTVG
uniref:Uncharacterized protein n=1 Tax=Vespula pensylvanica TaxID=30213 RepID=A0A834NSA3_VESPE|nr:hypothetical protein H0235_011658 [Vespula pensylvanica]